MTLHTAMVICFVGLILGKQELATPGRTKDLYEVCQFEFLALRKVNNIKH